MASLKIIIPMAGAGRRLEPLTKTRPKALIRLADRRLLDHILDSFQQLESNFELEYIFIIGHLGEQIQAHMRERHSQKKVTYFVQKELTGQSSAVYLAREAISGPVLLTYCDTINSMDYSFLPLMDADGAASVWEVEDPSRFGVAAIGADRRVTKLIEKPKTREHRSALTGIYYFNEGQDLIGGIEAQFAQDARVNNEYYLADAINLLVQKGLRIRTIPAALWLDAGTPGDLLKTNARLLELNEELQFRAAISSSVISPLFIDESARVENCVIGPNVSIGRDCVIQNSYLKETIVDDQSVIRNSRLEGSLIGKDCAVGGKHQNIILADGDYLK